MEAFVDEKPYIEYLAGRAVRKVSPKHRHSMVQFAFCELLNRLGRGRGTAGPEWRFRLAEGSRKTHLVPDASFMTYERWRALATDEEREEPPYAPDVAVEIRSRGDRESNVQWKIRAYLDAGTLLVFDVFPKQRRFVVYAKEGSREYLPGMTFEHTAVTWLRFEVDEAFAYLDPTE